MFKSVETCISTLKKSRAVPLWWLRTLILTPSLASSPIPTQGALFVNCYFSQNQGFTRDSSLSLTLHSMHQQSWRLCILDSWWRRLCAPLLEICGSENRNWDGTMVKIRWNSQWKGKERQPKNNLFKPKVQSTLRNPMLWETFNYQNWLLED